MLGLTDQLQVNHDLLQNVYRTAHQLAFSDRLLWQHKKGLVPLISAEKKCKYKANITWQHYRNVLHLRSLQMLSNHYTLTQNTVLTLNSSPIPNLINLKSDKWNGWWTILLGMTYICQEVNSPYLSRYSLLSTDMNEINISLLMQLGNSCFSLLCKN